MSRVVVSSDSGEAIFDSLRHL